MICRFTGPQLRALEWLPPDGSWVVKPPQAISRGIDSLHLYYKPLCDVEFGDFGPRGGRCRRARLTPDGVAKRSDLARYGTP